MLFKCRQTESVQIFLDAMKNSPDPCQVCRIIRSLKKKKKKIICQNSCKKKKKEFYFEANLSSL